MFVDKKLKQDAALVASVPKETISRNVVRSAIKRLMSVPGPNQWAPMRWRLQKSEFDEFRTISRKILLGNAASDREVRRLQLYAEAIFEVIDHEMRIHPSTAIAAE